MPKAKQSKTCMFGQVNHKQKFSLYPVDTGCNVGADGKALSKWTALLGR